MNAFFFGTKRTFHSTLRITRRWMAKLRLTPARFDMLKAISRQESGMPQGNLRAILGVTPQTISRMIRALEELKLVKRSRDMYRDCRKLWVSLTTLGKTKLRRAEKVFVLSGALQVAIDSALVEPDRMSDRGACYHAMDVADRFFAAIRLAFRDRANLYDRWRSFAE